MVATARPPVPDTVPPHVARQARIGPQAQLDVVHEISQALAQQLDFDAIVEPLRRIFRSRADDLYIALHDSVNDQITTTAR